MKKRIVAICAAAAVLALSALLLAGCGGTAKFENKILLGFDADGYEPYGFMNDKGDYVGFDIDLAKEVCARNGWELELCPVAWDTIQNEMDAGNINCIWNGLTRTPEREKAFAMTENYMYNAQVVVVKKGTYKEIKDLAGKKIVTQAGAPAYDLLTDAESEYKDIINAKDVELVAGYTTAFMEIESGTADAVACDLSIAQAQMAAKDGVYEIIGYLNEEAYCVAFNKKFTDVAEQVSKTLKEMYADGTVAKIAANWPSIKLDDWILK